MSKFFVDVNGRYLGEFPDDSPSSVGTEVSGPPDNGSQLWNGASWNPLTVYVLKSTVMARLIAANMMTQAYQGLTSNPVYFARWFAPDKPYVACDDSDAILFVRALELDPSVILAP